MNLAHKSRKIIITGQSGTGKSTYFTRFVENAFRTIYRNVFLFDHQGEFAARTGTPACLTEDDLVRAHQEQRLIAFDPSMMFPGETETAWNFFCEWTFERCKNNLGEPKLLAVDELQMFSSTSDLSWELSCVVETGRKFELDFLCISQQLNLIHNRLRNQATEVVTFRHLDQLILQALEKLGFDIEQVKTLPDLTYIDRDMLHSINKVGKLTIDSRGKPSETINESESSSVDEEPEDMENSE